MNFVFLMNKFLAHKTEPFDSSNIGYIIIYKKDQNVYQFQLLYDMNQPGEK